VREISFTSIKKFLSFVAPIVTKLTLLRHLSWKSDKRTDGQDLKKKNIYTHTHTHSKTCLKRNAIVPVFFSPRFHRFPFYKGLCFNKTEYKKYDRLGLQ